MKSHPTHPTSELHIVEKLYCRAWYRAKGILIKGLSVVGVSGRGHYDRPVTPTIRACFFCCKLQAMMVAARNKY